MTRGHFFFAVDRSVAAPILFVATVLAAATLQVQLSPRQPALVIPPTLGTLPGAAPQQSVAPPESLAVAAPSAVLPSESLPAQALPGTDQPSPAAMATRSEPSLWTDRLPRVGGLEAGAGNLKTKLKQPSAITTMIGALLRSLKRVELRAPAHVKGGVVSPPLKPAVPQSHPAAAHAIAPRPGWMLGGPVTRSATLGGPTPLAARYAPSINGAAIGHR